MMPSRSIDSLDTLLRNQLDHCLVETELGTLGKRYRGKVRDTYRTGDGRLVLVTTDRISAFDHILPRPIPFKGQVLNQLAAHFFRATHDIVPNHVLSVPDPNVTVALACEPIPIEFVVRGYLAGHAWRVYRDGGRTLCGVTLPDGLRQNSRFTRPILTPATKAAEGHDEDISREAIIERGLMDATVFDRIASFALRLFKRGSELAAERGLILVDTKYEFGFDAQGDVVLIDEVHTPDSSRYFYAEGYEERLARDEPQRQLSKEFVREWLMEQGFQGKDGQTMPDLPDDFRVLAAKRYIELFETVTGEPFEPDSHSDPESRIREALAGVVPGV
ncbi:MAG: phosphoribosylaminoimidazolesuccinocarboxamide synthase [Rhodothermales bacterium]